MPLIRLIFLTAAFAACSTLCRAQGKVSASNQQTIYPPGWDAIVSAWRQVEETEYNETGSYVATVEKKIKLAGGGGIRQETVVWNVRTKPGYKHVTATTVGTEEKSVYARSPDYAFAVKQRQQEQEWKLVHFTKSSTSIATQRFEESLPGKYSLSVLYPLGAALENDRCSKYFYEGNCKKYLKKLNLIAGEQSRLEWSYDWGYQASLVMDAPPYYLMRKFESRRTDLKSLPRRTTFVRELMTDGKRPNSSLPLCKSIVYKLVVDKEGGETMNDVRITFSDYSFDPPPDDIFRLSHYGLPEQAGPPNPNATRLKLWLGLFVASVSCFLLTALFRWLSRRKTKPPCPEGNPQ